MNDYTIFIINIKKNYSSYLSSPIVCGMLPDKRVAIFCIKSFWFMTLFGDESVNPDKSFKRLFILFKLLRLFNMFDAPLLLFKLFVKSTRLFTKSVLFSRLFAASLRLLSKSLVLIFKLPLFKILPRSPNNDLTFLLDMSSSIAALSFF